MAAPDQPDQGNSSGKTDQANSSRDKRQRLGARLRNRFNRNIARSTKSPKTIDPELLRQHSLWLSGAQPGGMRLTLEGDYCGADLHGKDLSSARISANLRYVNLRGTNLKGADLHDAILWDADLTDADLTDAAGLLPSDATSGIYPLSGADLTGAKLPDNVKDFPALVNITELCKNAGALFLSLVTGDAVILLMVLKTTDQQLITNTGTVTIPFLNTEVPTSTLFWLGPSLVLMNYIALLFYMQKLWELIAGLPAVFPDGLTLDQKSYPWMATNIVRSYFPRLRLRPQALTSTQRYLFANLIYTAVPASLIPIWARYLVAHDWRGTAAHVIIAWWYAFFCLSFLRLAQLTLGRNVGSLKELLPTTSRRTIVRKLKFFVPVVTAATSCAAVAYGIAWFGPFNGTPTSKLEADAPSDFFYRPGLTKVKYAVPRYLTSLGFSPFVDVHEKELSKKPDTWGVKPNVGSVTIPADLSGRDLRYGNFGSAFIARGDLRNSRIDHAQFIYSFMRRADLTEAHGTNANFVRADLEGARLERSNLADANLNSANLTNANFVSAHLEQADFTDANLTGAVFTDAHLDNTNFSEANLSRANLKGQDLSTAYLDSVTLDGTQLAEARIQGADLSYAHLTRADCYEANLRNANLFAAHLALTDLRSADLTDAVIEYGSFYRADLTDADLTRTDLRSADLEDAIGLNRAILRGAKYNVGKGGTRFPKDFRPDGHHMILVADED